METDPFEPTWGQKLLGIMVKSGFEVASRTASFIPKYRRALQQLECLKNLEYGPHITHRLDLHYPPGWSQKQASQTPLPTVFYIHGGGFRILSKDTHWPFVYSFTQQGYAVVNINYRLAPQWKCPAAVEDAVRALEWILDQSQSLGLNVNQFHIAGESAGGNLALAVGLCTVRKGSTSWSQSLYNRRWQPSSILPACGFLDAGHPESHKGYVPSFILKRIQALSEFYISGSTEPHWASPLKEIEDADQPWDRPFPPLCITVGDKDFIYRDSLRLYQACRRLNIPHQYHEYPRKGHAFHAILWTQDARQCWDDHFQFLNSLST